MKERWPGLAILGITGPIGCGKSTVAALTPALGAIDVIDADIVVHQLMGPNSDLSARIGHEFGPDVMAADGSVDRARLGAIVFAETERLRTLEELVHPAVRRHIAGVIQEGHASGQKGVITIEAVRLLDSPMRDWATAIWVVTCRRQAQLARLLSTRGYTAAEADSRIRSAPAFGARGVTTLRNDGSIDRLRQTVVAAWADSFGPKI